MHGCLSLVSGGCCRSRLCLNCDGTCAETRFLLSATRTSPFKSAGASVQSATGRRAVHISLQGLYCSCKPVFCSHVTLTGYPLHSLVSLSLPLPCVTVCHHISTGLYLPRADHSSRGVLPNVVCRCVCPRHLKNEEAITRVGGTNTDPTKHSSYSV